VSHLNKHKSTNCFIPTRFIDRAENTAQSHLQKGVILMVIPIIMILLGLFIAYMTRSVNLPDFSKEQATQQRMDSVLNALSSYAQRFHRVPCPALPDAAGAEPRGYEQGSGVNGTAIPAGNCVNAQGIIPYNTLGLNEDEARDEWGRYMTYAISPAFAVNPTVLRYASFPALPAAQSLPRSDSAANMRVHAACRSAAWLEFGKTNFIGKDNNNYFIAGGPVTAARNPWKARFCCAGIVAPSPSQNTDLIINVNGVNTAVRSGNAADYQRAEILGGGGGQIDVPVIALVSHGANNSGAYLGANAAGRSPTPAASFGAAEIANADNDRVFVQAPRVLGNNPANIFDDIVVFRTQNQLYSQTGRADCTTPF